MKVCIEWCEQSSHGISWEGVASLVKEAHRNGDTNIAERDIDLAYGLKVKNASILISHTINVFFNFIDVHVHFFPGIA